MARCVAAPVSAVVAMSAARTARASDHGSPRRLDIEPVDTDPDDIARDPAPHSSPPPNLTATKFPTLPRNLRVVLVLLKPLKKPPRQITCGCRFPATPSDSTGKKNRCLYLKHEGRRRRETRQQGRRGIKDRPPTAFSTD